MNPLDVRIALTHPRATARYALPYLTRYRRLANFLGISVSQVKELYAELYADPFFAEMRAKSDSIGAPIHAGMLSPLQAPALYVLVRAAKPQVLIETGVCNGWSTSFTLRALEQNGSGHLYSIDLPNASSAFLPPGKTTGWAIPDALRSRWELILGDNRVELPRLLARLQTIDWFFHDSDHSYDSMTFEFQTAWARLTRGGLLLSDDIRDHNAFDDFVRQAKLTKTLFLSTVGGIQKE